MGIELHTNIKPLIANLRRSNIGEYLATNDFSILMLEKDYDRVWEMAKRDISGNSSGVITISRRIQRYQSAFELILNSLFIKDNGEFRIILILVLENFIGWNKSTIDIDKLLTILGNLNVPQSDLSHIKSIFEKAQISKHADQTIGLINKPTIVRKNEVFIVHGHDELAKVEVARFIEKLGFTPIILHEQASSGKTIIEKIEEYSNVGFGIVLYTPCDIGGTSQNALKNRARQNVVFEHGYLIGKIGRKNVCALVKGEIETPNDISGVVYVGMDASKGWQMGVAKELKSSGYNVDMNILF